MKRPKEGRMFLARQTCGRACQQKKKNERVRLWHKAQRAKEPIVKPSPGGWPYVTGPIEADFRPFNEEPGDKRGYRPSRPGTLVKTQSSIA